jgi:hypothetical protein
LQKLGLADLTPAKQRLEGPLLGGGAVARQRDPERDAAHLVKPPHHALFRLGFDHAFDDLSRMIRGAVLIKSHMS